nr:MAG TPA: hypothetical protein [Caudoviricetes sp.]DAX81967.1 MAG TPA: hypothetical protein [Caudoviricetes sp.]
MGNSNARKEYQAGYVPKNDLGGDIKLIGFG